MLVFRNDLRVELPLVLGATRDTATIRDKVGHLETLPIDLLYGHLDVSFIFTHLDAMNGGPNFSSVTPPRKKAANLVKMRLLGNAGSIYKGLRKQSS
jgi:hypothetical protein